MPNLHSFPAKAKELWVEHQLEFWIALILAAGCAVAIELWRTDWVGPDSYKICLVGEKEKDQVKTIYKPFSEAASNNPLYINGVRVRFEVEDDHGSPTTAAQIARRLRGENDTLLVIGGGRSQETKAMVPIYMSASPRIPVITTTESDDDLVSSCPECDNEYAPMLQLSPTNKVQAASAVKYAIEKGRRRFLIVSERNSDNPDYSANLVHDFRQALENAYPKPMLVGEIQLGEPPSVEALKHLNPDCVLYAGEAGPAHSLVDSISGYAGHRQVTVVLSDAAVTPSLPEDAINKFKTVSYTYAYDAFFFRQTNNMFGEDAFAIVSQLIGDTELYPRSTSERVRRFLHMNRVTDARQDLIGVMEKNLLKNHVYVGESGDRYSFANYQRQDRFFHVWEVQNGAVQDVDKWHPPLRPTGFEPASGAATVH
jgi:hypothetical protein